MLAAFETATSDPSHFHNFLLGEGYPPDTYTDPLEEKEAAWLLKECPK